MPTSTQQIISWLTKLRVVHEPHAKRSVDAIEMQNSVYVDALRGMDPRWLNAAVSWWCSDGEKFPKPVDLRRKAEELQAEAEKADRIHECALTSGDPGSTLRNEAICLLGDLDNAARRHFGGGDGVTGAGSPAYLQFLNDASGIWAGQRPQDQIVNGRFMTGYDLAVQRRLHTGAAASLRAWAATRLRDGAIGTTPVGGSPVNAA